jgi:uncharacterized membrane protein
MFDMGVGELLVWFVSVAALIAIPVAVIALGIRIGLAGRDDPRRRLRDRLARGEITQAEFETAIRALGN